MEVLTFTIAFLVGIFLSVIVHEIGHLVCGLMSGYRFVSFRLMKLLWVKDNKSGKIKLTHSTGIKGIVGQCLLDPPENEQDFRFVLYNLGGGLFNIITGAAVIILYLLIDNDLWELGLLILWVSAIYLGVTNLIPMTVGGIPNDGKNIKEARKSADAKHGFYIGLKINAEMSKGKRMRDFDMDAFIIGEGADTSNYFVANMILLHASRLEESGAYVQSYQELLRLKAHKLPPYYNNMLLLALMFQELILFGDELHIQCARERIDAKSKDKYFQNMLKMKHPSFLPYHATKQAFLDGNTDRASELIQQAKSLAPSLQNPGQEYSIALMLEKIEAKLHAQR